MNRAGSQPDAVLLSVGWGALWGVVLGFWFLAPAVIETHRLWPENPAQWAVFLGAMSVIFGALGATLGFVGGLALLSIEKLTGAFRERTWAYGLFGGPTLAVAYALQSVLSHVSNFGLIWVEQRAEAEAILFIAVCVTTLALLCLLYRAITTRVHKQPPALLGCTLSALAVAGAAVLVQHSPTVPQRETDIGPLQADPSREGDVPLIFIGLDGGSWRVLKPAMENGYAPTLRRLAERGITGNVDALWSPYHWSAAAWGSIVTGQPRDATGVYEALAAQAPGLPLFQVPLEEILRLNPIYNVRALLVQSGVVSFIPPPRPLLKAKPIWQLLHEAGVRSAVVRLRFTYPPHGQADVVVSDWVGRDQWEGLDVRKEAVLTPVIPEQRAEELLEPFRSEGPSDPDCWPALSQAHVLPSPVTSGWIRYTNSKSHRTSTTARLTSASAS